MTEINRKKNLLFGSVGDKSVHNSFWLNEKQHKNFDLAIYYYGDQKNRYENEADYYKQKKGSKWQNLSHFCWHHKQEIEQYDGIFVLDDDIEIGTRSINKLFDVLYEYNLWLCQPAFTKDSYITLPVTKKKDESILRYTNYVESGVMLFSGDAFRKCLSLFFDTISGYGMDTLCSPILGSPIDKIAIIDSVECRHLKKHSDMDAYIPRELHSVEGINLKHKYKVARILEAYEYGGVRLGGKKYFNY